MPSKSRAACGPYGVVSSGGKNVIRLFTPDESRSWGFPILFEDEHYIALDKMSHMAVTHTQLFPNRPSLLQLIQHAVDSDARWVTKRNARHFSFAYRIDFETSGITLFCCNNGEIQIKTSYEGDYRFRVVIEDNGPGIPEDLLESVFEPYHTTKERGTGLGLAIVRHNTELYGGTVEIESELGKYTRFNLLFPGRTAIRLQSQ